jgi:NADH-quinone oxidoreductase subunit J
MVDLIFYAFAILMVLAGLMVISLKNPVHSVLFLIFAFFNASGLFILIGAEYIAMTLIIVYVGAVAVLFLFVVMMLNINVASLKQGFLKSLPLGVSLGFLIFVQMYLAIDSSKERFADPAATQTELTNTAAIGKVLYTDYIYIFQISGIILLVAMIGAIVLTLTHGRNVRRQNICKQISRKREKTIEMVKVKSGEGVEI